MAILAALTFTAVGYLFVPLAVLMWAAVVVPWRIGHGLDISASPLWRVVDVIAEVAAAHGLDNRHHDTVLEPGYDAWLHSEMLTKSEGSEWLAIEVLDRSLDASGEALADFEQYGGLEAGVSLFYGITTIRDQDRPEFERRTAPFAGLTRPEASHPS